MKLLLLQRDISVLIEETKTKVIANVEGLAAAMTKVTTYFDQAYQPDEIETQVDLMAKLDGRIEKAIRRLTAIKVFKRVDGVEAPIPYRDSPSLVPDATKALVAAHEGNETKVSGAIKQKPVAAAAPEHRKIEKPKG